MDVLLTSSHNESVACEADKSDTLLRKDVADRLPPTAPGKRGRSSRVAPTEGDSPSGSRPKRVKNSRVIAKATPSIDADANSVEPDASTDVDPVLWSNAGRPLRRSAAEARQSMYISMASFFHFF